jgi:hypothetical protein
MLDRPKFQPLRRSRAGAERNRQTFSFSQGEGFPRGFPLLLRLLRLLSPRKARPVGHKPWVQTAVLDIPRYPSQTGNRPAELDSWLRPARALRDDQDKDGRADPVLGNQSLHLTGVDMEDLVLKTRGFLSVGCGVPQSFDMAAAV